MSSADRIEVGPSRIHLCIGRADDRQRGCICIAEQTRAQTVHQIMIIISNVVGKGCDLRFRRGMSIQFKIMVRIIVRQCIGQRAGHRAIVFCNGLKGFPCQVEAVKAGIMSFQRRDDLDRLGVVIKPAMGRHQRVQGIFARVAKGRVPQIMGKSHGFGQFLIQPQSASDCARHLGDLDRMGQAGPEMIALVLHKHLSFVLESPKCRTVDNPVAIPLETRAESAFFFGVQPPF